MFFGKRRHAVKIVEELGLPIRSLEATALIGIVVDGAKQFAQMLKSVGQKPDDLDCVLMSIGSARTNATAWARLQTDATIDGESALMLLHQLTGAANLYAYQRGRASVAEKFLNTTQKRPS